MLPEAEAAVRLVPMMCEDGLTRSSIVVVPAHFPRDRHVSGMSVDGILRQMHLHGFQKVRGQARGVHRWVRQDIPTFSIADVLGMTPIRRAPKGGGPKEGRLVKGSLIRERRDSK